MERNPTLQKFTRNHKRHRIDEAILSGKKQSKRHHSLSLTSDNTKAEEKCGIGTKTGHLNQWKVTESRNKPTYLKSINLQQT